MENKYDYQCGTSDQDPPWINAPNNGGDIGDLIDIAAELNRLRGLLGKFRSKISDFKGHGMPGFMDRAEAILILEEVDAELRGQNNQAQPPQ